MNISQNFVVEIIRPNGDEEVVVAPNLAAAITSWEREFNEEQESEEPEDSSEDSQGFLVPEGDADEADDEDGDADDEELDADSTLCMTAYVNKEVLQDIKDLQNSEDPSLLKIRIIYGSEQIGRLVREFDVGADVFMSLGSGSKIEASSNLVVGLTFDVYDSALVF